MKRSLELVIISDVHLGTFGCHAAQLLQYLRSIKPQILVLNGDFIDAWQFRKKYFPLAHMEVINQIIKMSVNGTKVYYITGNHDDVLRKFSDTHAGNIFLKDKLVLNLGSKNYWIFHGDIFDISILKTPWLAKMGGKGYDLLIRVNRLVNRARRAAGFGEWSFASRIKVSVKHAIKFIGDFEQKAIEVAAEKGFDGVICGHIHIPMIKTVMVEDSPILYLNSGDWVENLTALEYNGSWKLYRYNGNDYIVVNKRLTVTETVRHKELNRLTHQELISKIVDFT